LRNRRLTGLAVTKNGDSSIYRGSRLKNAYQLLWVVFGAAYGLGMRIFFDHAPHFFGLRVVSIAFMLGTPVAIGAIVIYGLRDTKPSIIKMIFAPWLSILLALIGSAISLLEGSVCIALASPLFFVASSIGGLIMGFVLRWTNKGKITLNSVLVLPIILMFVEPAAPQQAQLLEDRVSVEVAASPHRIWEEILNARNIRKEELPWNFTHWIGVPRPVEGVNVMTPEGEVRYSKWERGVNFSALVTERIEDRSITWRYRFTSNSFPEGSLDEHVKIGGQYFDLRDTTFNLTPISANLTKVEIVSHYRVTTDVNFYGVPIARFIANDFMSTILHLYKFRSEQSAG
jgi:hypothetical protein